MVGCKQTTCLCATKMTISEIEISIKRNKAILFELKFTQLCVKSKESLLYSIFAFEFVVLCNLGVCVMDIMCAIWLLLCDYWNENCSFNAARNFNVVFMFAFSFISLCDYTIIFVWVEMQLNWQVLICRWIVSFHFLRGKILKSEENTNLLL